MSFIKHFFRCALSLPCGVVLFCLLLLFVPRQASCHLTLFDDDSRIIVDEANGAFSFCSSNRMESSGPMESRGWQLSSYAVVYHKGKPLLVGGDKGRLEKCGIIDNTIEYSWSSGNLLCSEKFFFSPSPVKSSPGIVCSFQPRGKTAKGKFETVKILVVLDLKDVSVLDCQRKTRTEGFTVWTNLDDLVFSSGTRWFRIRTPPGCGQPFLVAFDDWNELTSNLDDPLLYQKRRKSSGETVKDPSIGVLWSFMTDFKKPEERGLLLERFIPVPDSTVCSLGFAGSPEILPETSKIQVILRNGSFVPMKNTVLKLTNDGNFAVEKESLRPGDIPAYTSVTQRFYCYSLSPQDRTARITASCTFGPENAPLTVRSAVDCVVSRTILPVVCDYISNSSPPSFKLHWMKRITAGTQQLIIEDLDGRIADKIPVPDRGIGLISGSKTLPAGATYSYWVEATRENGVLATEKKMFATDPERVESADSIVIRFPSVNFNYNSAALKSQAYAVLKKVAFLLRQYPGKKVRIEGHTDNTGNRQSNLSLSLQRASAVNDYLAGVEGFEPGRFEVKGLADAFPVAANDTEENRFKNRRVEIIIEK